MPTFKARAIILRSHKLGEADKIIRMYSKQGNIISAVAKGSRKIKSRFIEDIKVMELKYRRQVQVQVQKPGGVALF